MENISRAINHYIKMDKDSIDLIVNHLQERQVKKKEILTSSDKKDSYLYFIEKGITRSFCIYEGKEFTSWFSKEGDITFSTNSFYGNIPGYENEVVQVLEDSLLYALPIDYLNSLCQQNIQIANWLRLVHQKAFVAIESRFIDRLYKSAEERYKKLLHEQPDLFQRVNLGYIASYLGISQVTLCQLRNKIV